MLKSASVGVSAVSAFPSGAKARRLPLTLRPLVAAIACLLPLPTLANCVTTGLTTTCDTNAPSPWTTLLGNGASTPSGSILNVLANAQISTGNSVAISYGDNARINLGENSVVQNTAPTAQGPYNTGGNTIEFGSNGILNVGVGAQVISNAGRSAEAVNVIGGNNQIINRGLISATQANAIYFQTTAGGNVVDNYGTIRTLLGSTASVIGQGGTGNGSITFTNRTGARIEGSLNFGGGNDTFNLEAGSVVTGNFNGGGGSNTLNLSGAADTADTLTGAINNFSNLNKIGDGLWTISGALGNSNLAPLAVNVQQGNLTLTGNNTNLRGTVTVSSAGTLEARAQSLPTSVTDDGLVRFAQPDTGTYAGVISGIGAVEKTGVGNTTLSGVNTYSGGTNFLQGFLQANADNNLGAANGALNFNGGGLRLGSTFDLAAGRTINVSNGGGTIDTNGFDTVVSQAITGAGALNKAGAGTLALTGTNAYTGGTTISGGILQLGNGGTTGGVVGNVVDNGTLAFNRSDELIFTNTISGTGGLQKLAADTLTLTAANSYTGLTTINAGSLYVNGDQSAATGATTVENGATLGGTGALGGDVTVADGGILSPGTANAPGTLTINGNLGLSAGSVLNYRFGQANTPGGTLNDLTDVGGNLTLDGTLNVTPQGGMLGQGIYRVFNYNGALTNNGLVLGNLSPNFYVQTSVANQVNLVNTNGLTLNYWDGAAGPKNDDAVNGGDGTWQSDAGNDNWTTADGAVNAPFANGAFAIFEGTPGAVTVDNSLGTVTIAGAQFASNGYVVQGNPITLAGTTADPTQSIIRVGDGTTAGASDTATIKSVLQGTSGLTKTDAGTLVLGGANTYTGGTAINGGTLQIASDANLGAAAGALSFDDGTLHSTASLASNRVVTLNAGGGMLDTDAGTTLTLGGVIGGAGALTKIGTGTTVLTGDNTYTGLTTIGAGTLQLGNGGTTGSLAGAIVDNGVLAIDHSNAVIVPGAISGIGSLQQNGSGTTLLTGDNTYAGGTTINAGTVQLGNGGTTGSLIGDVTDNGILAFNRADAVTFNGVVSGTGGLQQNGVGATTVTGANSYTGLTTINAGSLYVNGDQSAATGATSAANGATLGGSGTLGGDVTVADGGTLSPGGNSPAPGTLTINGNLGLSGGSTLDYSFGKGNVAGGAFNDLTNVGGDLILDGTLNVDTPPGGTFGAGVYRVINYTGALTNNGLTLGTIPSPTFQVQTAVANQVNLINTAGLNLNFWDGAAGPQNNSVVNGGDGTWQNANGNTSWTDANGVVNAPYADRAFAIFEGEPGTVTVDNSLGAVTIAGAQFASNGYVVQGNPITLAGTVADPTRSVIRVGDGTAAGAADTATIDSVLQGSSGLTKTDLGTLVLNGANTYTGGTEINGGTLQVASDGNLGDAAGGLSFDDGTLHTTADLATARVVTLNAGGGTLTPADGTTLTVNGAIGGVGGLTTTGPGITILTGTNTYAGATAATTGTLQVNGDQSGATGATSVASGAILRGIGTLGGDVTLADGGILSPGTAATPGTLTVNGSLGLSGGSILNYRFGQADVAGGPFNDLTNVGGNLTLDGTLNVTTSPGGLFGPGVYRVFNYAGTLTDNGLALSTPTPDLFVQTSVTNQVNLVNTQGLALTYWDGAVGPKNNGVVDGGDGTWQNINGNDNWTDVAGAVNAPFADRSFAIFEGARGTITVDNSLGNVTIAGAQFATDGYIVQGDPVTLAGSTVDPTQTVIRVGDGSTASVTTTAIINSVLQGTSGLVKTDAGTLVLGAANTYTGGTSINGGTLQIASDANLGDAAGALSFFGGTLHNTADVASHRAVSVNTDDGTLDTDANTTLTLDAIDGTGGLIKAGAGTALLNGTSTYQGTTTVADGALAIGDAAHVGAALGGSGATTVADGATLGGYGTVTGDVDNQGTIAVADALPAFAGSGPGSFTIAGSLSNGGLVQLGGAGVGNTLTTTNYAGQNGRLALNAQLAGDDAPSDQLVINGGTASGSTTLQVSNVGGKGALTPGNGIQVVNPINGGTTSAGAFSLGNRLIAGPYEYTLFRGGRDGSTPDAYYLRNEATDGVGGGSGRGGMGGGDNAPNYRREVSDYTALSSMMANFGRETLGTLHERVGEQATLPTDNDGVDGVWARVIGQEGKWNAKSGGIYRDGPSFDDNFVAVQAGADLFHEEKDDGSRNRAGVYGTAGHGRGDVYHYDGSNAGLNQFDAFSMGAYWTHYTPTNAYLDTVLQGTSYQDAKSGSNPLGQLKTHGFSFAASVEGGAPFQLQNQWQIEPQAQLIYQGVSVNNASDSAAQVSFGNVNSLAGRVGARLSHRFVLEESAQARNLDLWLRGNVWHEFRADPTTSLSSDTGEVPFHSDLRGSWYEVQAGVTAQVSRTTSLYANLGYDKAFSHGVQAVNGTVGVRVNW